MIMGRLVESIAFQMDLAEVINKDDEDRQISFRLRMFFAESDLLSILFAYQPYVTYAYVCNGQRCGFDANTEQGRWLSCKFKSWMLFFSCSMVFLLCFLNKIMVSARWFLSMGVIANIMIVCFSPVENINRILEQSEQRVFKRQAFSPQTLMFMDFIRIGNGQRRNSEWQCTVNRKR